MKVKLLVDSPASIPLEFLKQNNISVLEVNITIEDKTKKELSEIDSDWFIENFNSFENLPLVKQAPSKEAKNIFEKAVEKGYTKILYPYMSPLVSDQVNAVMSAAKKLENKLKVEFYSTELSGPSQAPFILYANQLLKEKKSVEEITEIFEKYKDSIYTIGVSKDISNLFLTKKIRRNIPISLATSLFRIRPIYEILPNKGIIGTYGGLGTEGAIRNMLNEIRRKVNSDLKYNLILTHSNAKNIVERLENEICELLDIKETVCWNIPPAIIVTVGIGAVMATLYPSID